MKIDITEVQKGDVVLFASFALRVEEEPKRARNSITLRGRISTDGCPMVERTYIKGKTVKVER